MVLMRIPIRYWGRGNGGEELRGNSFLLLTFFYENREEQCNFNNYTILVSQHRENFETALGRKLFCIRLSEK